MWKGGWADGWEMAFVRGWETKELNYMPNRERTKVGKHRKKWHSKFSKKKKKKNKPIKTRFLSYHVVSMQASLHWCKGKGTNPSYLNQASGWLGSWRDLWSRWGAGVAQSGDGRGVTERLGTCCGSRSRWYHCEGLWVWTGSPIYNESAMNEEPKVISFILLCFSRVAGDISG